MDFTSILSILLLFQIEWDAVLCQGAALGTFANIQDFLNNLCLVSPENEGCKTGSIDPQGPVNTPRPNPIQPTPAPSGCFPDEKRCPQLTTKCVPQEIDCNLINTGISCSIPKKYGAETQVLICGDDTAIGVRCRNGENVPFLTVILVQCQGSNQINPRPVSSLDVLNGPGDSGGAGVYRCSQSGSWEPKLDSPNIGRLTLSCRNVGCGNVPHPSKELPVHRRWSWVRGIYKNQKLHCTGTLVSPNALVTAAHCVTISPVSNQVDFNSNYQIELPGPDFRNNEIKVIPDRILIHPRYMFNNGAYQHDLAIMFFNLVRNYNLPTVCISDQPYSTNIGRAPVVFDQEDQGNHPYWKSIDANWDYACISSVTTRFNDRCINTIPVQESQFCAYHRDTLQLSKGSSGGPFLAEVGDDVNEVWVLMGVLSKSSVITDGQSCRQEHSVFEQVTDNSRWMKDCVFDNRCAF